MTAALTGALPAVDLHVKKMGRKHLSVPTLHKPNLKPVDWWEGVRGGVKYLGEKLPQKFAELPRKVAELETLQRKLSLSSLNTSEPQVNECGRLSIRDDPGSSEIRETEPARLRKNSTGSEIRESEPRLRDRLSLMMPKYERLENKVKNVRRDLSRLRSKSCDRLLKRRKSGRISPVQTATLYDEEYFQINSTLRRSRRLQERKKRYSGPFVGVARAKVDCIPSPYDTEGLPYKAGDLIHIIRRGQSGLWLGEVNGRVGNFKFINVEEMEMMPRSGEEGIPESTVTGLLCRLELAHLTSRLVLNGWDSLGKLEKISRKDLLYLGVEDKEEQDKLLSAVSVLQGTSASEARIRTVSRIDSGYYEKRDSESEDGRSISTNSVGFNSCDSVTSNDLHSSPASEASLKTSLNSRESRKRFDSVTESKLSIAEPNPQLNKSF